MGLLLIDDHSETILISLLHRAVLLTVHKFRGSIGMSVNEKLEFETQVSHIHLSAVSVQPFRF